MSKEQMTILQMVAEKKITAEQGARLLEALESSEQMDGKKTAHEGDARRRAGTGAYTFSGAFDPFSTSSGKFRHKKWHRRQRQCGDWQERLHEFSGMINDFFRNMGGFPDQNQNQDWSQDTNRSQTGAETDREPQSVHEVDIPEGSAVSINCRGGHLSIQGWDGEKLRIRPSEAWITFGSHKPLVTVEEQEKQVFIHLRSRHATLDVPWRMVALRIDARAGNITLEDVSADCELDLKGGSLEANGLSGRIHAGVAGGNVTFRDIHSTDMDVRVQGGSISVNMNPITEGSARLEVQGGAARLALTPDSAFELNATAHMGRISSTISGEKKSEMTGERFHATQNGGGADIVLTVHAGSIDLTHASRSNSDE